jgi:hypothetical protein
MVEAAGLISNRAQATRRGLSWDCRAQSLVLEEGPPMLLYYGQSCTRTVHGVA